MYSVSAQITCMYSRVNILYIKPHTGLLSICDNLCIHVVVMTNQMTLTDDQGEGQAEHVSHDLILVEVVVNDRLGDT